jgi:hypothetical protein
MTKTFRYCAYHMLPTAIELGWRFTCFLGHPHGYYSVLVEHDDKDAPWFE